MKEKPIKENLKSRTNVKKLQQEEDKDISYQENPATTKEFWKNAEVYMPQHKVVT